MRKITFGSAPEDLAGAVPHIHIEDEYVNAKHCSVEQRNGHYILEDLGSTNGTRLVGPAAIETKVWGPTEILPGHHVRIGRTILPFEVSKLDYFAAVLRRSPGMPNA